MFHLGICWCVHCTRYGVWSEHLYSRKAVYSPQRTHRGSFVIHESMQKSLECGGGNCSEPVYVQVFEFVLATLTSKHENESCFLGLYVSIHIVPKYFCTVCEQTSCR